MHLLISKKIIIYLLIFCFLVSIHNISLINLNFPKINKIEIIGLNLNEKKKIENIINDANFENIFYLDKQYLQKKINSINIIEQFEIFKNYPSTLKIFIKQTKILAQTKKNGSDYFIGSNGKLIKNNFDILLAGGQDHLKGKIFRIGHLGFVNDRDIISVISALESTLDKMGKLKTPIGKGISKTISVLNNESEVFNK